MNFKVIILILSLFHAKIEAKPATSEIISPAAGSLRLTLHNQTAWENLNKTCLLNDCDDYVNLRHLRSIGSYINISIDPCENFHAYACSNWWQQYPQQKSVTALGEQQLNNKFANMFSVSNDVFDTLFKGDLVMQKMQKYLKVCLQSEIQSKATWKHYISTLQQLGYLDFANNINWLQVLRNFNLFANNRFFISLQMDRFNATRFMISIEPHSTYKKAKLSLDIFNTLQVFTNDSYLKVCNDFKKLESDLDTILKTSCHNAISDENAECDVLQWMTYGELRKSNSTVDWEYLLADFPLQLNDQILVNDLQSINRIKYFLDQTSQKTILLYAVTRFINYLQSNKHNIVDRGSDMQSCLRHMRKHFPLAMNYLYEKAYYTKKRAQSDNVIHHIFSQLKQQFAVILDTNEMQFSAASLQYLKQKLQHLQLNIGNLPENAVEYFYTNHMADLNVTNNFYSNHLMALKHFFQRQRLLASPTKFEDFWYSFNLQAPDFLDNIDSTPHYFSIANIIIIPFAYLQLPFYDYRLWPSLLYGDLANTLGHELIHAFDTKFLEHDYAGNYNEEEVLDILNNKRFQQNVACLDRQPTKFITERMADISGTRLALNSFSKDPLFLKHNGKIFFLQFAQFFCGSANVGDFQLEDDLHDLDSLRLNYTLQHMPEFAEVFQCPLGSPMNPQMKCKFW